MTEPVAVLICVCAGDRLNWFADAINSVIRQDYTGGAIRIYLGVDGPLSNSEEEWITENRSKFYKIIRNKVNSGLSKTLNRLVKASRPSTAG
jgi:GT2 family glycosyltransferase